MKQIEQTHRRRILAVLLALLPPGPFSIAMIEKHLRPIMTRPEIHLAMGGFVQEGKAAALKKLSGERLYLFPLEQLMEVTVAQFGLPTMTDEWSGATIPNERPDLVLELLTIVDQITASESELTKKGTLPKKQAEQWASIITIDDRTCEEVLQRKQVKTLYPPKTAIALDLLLRSGWVQVSDGKLVALNSRLGSWMSRPDSSWELFIYRLWIEAFTPVSPLARVIGYIWPYLPEGRWLSEEQLLSWWNEITAELVNKQEAQADRQWQEELNILQAAGWLEAGRSAEGQLAFRKPERQISSDDSDKTLYVQPDMELMLPTRRHYALHYLLMGISELQRHDRVRLYKLSARSMKQAFARGWTAELVRALLERHAKYGMPHPVIAAVEQWQQDASLYQAEPVFALRFRSAEAAMELASIAPLTSLLTEERRFNSTTYILNRQEHQRFAEVLKELGITDRSQKTSDEPAAYDPRLTLVNHLGEIALPVHDSEANNADCLAQAQGLFHSPYRADAYQRVRPLIQADELYPGIRDVPAMWLNERRDYHASTKAAICEQAISWNCYLEAVYEHNPIILIPIRITSNDPVTIHGYLDGEPFSAPLFALTKLRLRPVLLPTFQNSLSKKKRFMI